MHWVALVAEHSPQAPVGRHAGVVPSQSSSSRQAAQVWLVRLQRGVAPVQSESAAQATQFPSSTSQTGADASQAASLVAEHSPHVPLGWHAGVAPLQFASLVQPPTVSVAITVVPFPPLLDVITPVVFCNDPIVNARTSTENMQEAAEPSVAPVSLIEDEPATAAIVPPPQVPVTPLGVATTRPAGSESVKPTPVNESPVLGLVTVKVSEVLSFR